MSFFKQIGRKVEQFKRTATEAAGESGDYQCRACDARFRTDHDQCPECRAETITRTTTEK